MLDTGEVRILRVENKFQVDPMVEKTVDAFFCSKGLPAWREAPYSQLSKAVPRLIHNCHMCPYYTTSKGPVAPKPIERPRAWFIGRNPGKGDDIVSQLFSNDASGGKVYEKYLRVLNLRDSEVYKTNCVHCRTPANAPPVPHAVSLCQGWKALEFLYISVPHYIFAAGNDALRLFFGPTYPAVSRVYGDLYLTTLYSQDTLIIPVQHPGFILRHPEELPNTLLLLQQVSQIISNPTSFNLPWEA